MSNGIWFDPTSDKLVLSDGEHYLEVPYWARGIIADEFERETEPLRTENDKLRELVRDFYNDEEMMNPVKPDGFCAWGERK